MNLIPIPSKECPHCDKTEGNCSMVINEVQTFRAWFVKANEYDFRASLQGKTNSREAYVVHQYVCLEGKGIS